MAKLISRRRRLRGPDRRRSSRSRAMASSFSAAPSPHEALAAFMRAGRRDLLIRELTRKWAALGRDEVEEAVDEAIAQAARGMRGSREEAVYDYLRTAAHRALNRRKQRVGRASAPITADLDFDQVVGDALGPDELLIADEDRQVVRDIAASLDARTGAVMRLKHVDGLERKDVADALGISEKAVKKAIERGNRKCRDLYARADDGALCAERARSLQAVLGGSPTDADSRALEHHIAHCAACRSEVRRAVVLRRAAAALVPLPVSDSLLGRLGAAFRGASQLKDAILVRLLAVHDAASLTSGLPAAKAGAVLIAVAALGTAVVPHASSPKSAPARAAHSTGMRAATTPTQSMPAPAVAQVRRIASRPKPRRQPAHEEPKFSRRAESKSGTLRSSAKPQPAPPAPRTTPSKQPSEEFPIF